MVLKGAEMQMALTLSPPGVLNTARTPATPGSPKTLMKTAFGISLGLILGVFWVFVSKGWQNSDHSSTVDTTKDEKAV